MNTDSNIVYAETTPGPVTIYLFVLSIAVGFEAFGGV